MQRCAVFSCLGMGDGLIALVLANNLHLNGAEVITFHPFLSSLQHWFPHLPIQGFPSLDALDAAFEKFDRFYIIFERSSWMQAIIQHCQNHYPERTTILNPIATPRQDYPYWEGGRFNGSRPFVENLYAFCKDVLKFSVATKSNGISIPDTLVPRRFEKRVVIHPCSSREGKNWSQERYLRLKNDLELKGYSAALILTKEERQGWNVEAPLFANLHEIAGYVCESGYMIGNDSGIGHLASCLSLPTLTICRNAQAARFWRPAWARGEVITPSPWIPNIKGLRLRDKHWKKWISVAKVLSCFDLLVRS